MKFKLTSSHSFMSPDLETIHDSAHRAWATAGSDWAQSDHGQAHWTTLFEAADMQVRSKPGVFVTEDGVEFRVEAINLDKLHAQALGMPTKATLSVIASQLYRFIINLSKGMEYDPYPEFESDYYDRSLDTGVAEILRDCEWSAAEFLDVLEGRTSVQYVYKNNLSEVSRLDTRAPKDWIQIWKCCDQVVIECTCAWEETHSHPTPARHNVSDGTVHVHSKTYPVGIEHSRAHRRIKQG